MPAFIIFRHRILILYMSLIQHPVTLTGPHIELRPLERAHFPELLAIAAHPQIWEHMAMNGGDQDTLASYLTTTLLRRAAGEVYPFVVIDKSTGSVVGTSMYHSIFPAWRKLEIGYTWFHPQVWRTGVNRETKLLMLTHCFETLETIRVQFVTDENNHRSRTALLGIGAVQEGIMRNERIRHNGAYRNTVVFSIIDTEWPAVRARLQAQVSL